MWILRAATITCRLIIHYSKLLSHLPYFPYRKPSLKYTLVSNNSDENSRSHLNTGRIEYTLHLLNIDKCSLMRYYELSSLITDICKNIMIDRILKLKWNDSCLTSYRYIWIVFSVWWFAEIGNNQWNCWRQYNYLSHSHMLKKWEIIEYFYAGLQFQLYDSQGNSMLNYPTSYTYQCQIDLTVKCCSVNVIRWTASRRRGRRRLASKQRYCHIRQTICSTRFGVRVCLLVVWCKNF